MTKKWQGQRTTLEMTGGSLPADPFGVLQDITISPTQEVQELRGSGDIRWVDLMRTSIGIEISGTVSAFDIDTWDAMVEFDEAAGAFPSDPDVQTFTTTTTLESSDGSTKEIVAEPGYFDPLPELSGSREDWITMDVSVTCKEVTAINNTDASA